MINITDLLVWFQKFLNVVIVSQHCCDTENIIIFNYKTGIKAQWDLAKIKVWYVQQTPKFLASAPSSGIVFPFQQLRNY